METLVLQKKNQEVVNIFSWVLIVISAFVLLRSILFLNGYSSMIKMQLITKNFDPPVGINFTLYFIQSGLELLLSIVVFVSATFVLKYSNRWRKVLVYGLIISIIFLMVSPIISYYNIDNVIVGVDKIPRLIWRYSLSIILSTFFIFVIIKLSKEEVKLLFR
ncbi:MAG: hypothetical protein WC879_09960 [Melioribacteraceae bacterium]